MMIKNKLSYITLALIVFGIWPMLSLGNGGDQRIVAGQYIVNLSRAPFTPVAGKQNSMIISFGDAQADAIVTEDLIVDIRIAKLVGANSILLSQLSELQAADGVVEFKYTFTEPGLHEIFVDFAFVDAPTVVYSAPDFLFDVQPVPPQTQDYYLDPLWPRLGWVLGSGVGGVGIGWLLHHRYLATR